jgi:hypothetical protein
VTDPIADALDEFVPAFDSAPGDWRSILKSASRPASLAPTDHRMRVARRPARRRTPLGRRTVRLATAFAVLAVATTLGVAWAAGAWTPTSPLALFESNPQGTEEENTPGTAPSWNQTVIAGSVRQVASVEIPKVGPVALWHADTKQGGWCEGLRLSNGDWLGTGESSLDDGGTVPGCFPTGVIDTGNDGIEWNENDLDARSAGGDEWRIRSGLITRPGAVKVTDVTTGESTDVVDGDLFILAIQAPNPSVAPYKSPRFHLVAYDKAGKVVASDCRDCSGG